jgi:hypothetical protein
MSSSLNGTGVTFSDSTTQSTAWPGNTGTVTSVATSNGVTGGTITGSGTISLDFYTGTAANNTSFPVGSYLFAQTQVNANQTIALKLVTTNATTNPGYGGNSTALAGTWRARGSNTVTATYNCGNVSVSGGITTLFQRTA